MSYLAYASAFLVPFKITCQIFSGILILEILMIPEKLSLDIKGFKCCMMSHAMIDQYMNSMSGK